MDEIFHLYRRIQSRNRIESDLYPVGVQRFDGDFLLRTQVPANIVIEDGFYWINETGFAGSFLAR
jgi:hypothetical protein